MNRLIAFLCIFYLISCNERKNNVHEQVSEFSDTIIKRKALMSFIDNDSLYNQSFKSLSEFDGEFLRWTINFYENGVKKQIINDSIKGKSYLVKATDLNNDSISELVFITADFYPKDSINQNLMTTIFIYHLQNNFWNKILVPDLVSQLGGKLYEGEVVQVVENKIIRTYSHYTEAYSNGKENVISYQLSKSNELIVKKY